jgi:hypothetical protein
MMTTDRPLNALTEAFRLADEASKSGPKRRHTHEHIKWSESEWIAVAKALARLFPDLGLPSPEGVARIKVSHMNQAMQVLPANRRRALVQAVGVRSQLLRVCRVIAAETARPERAAAPPAAASNPVPASVVYRQPDGADDGSPPPGSRIFWRDPEWYAVAVELAYKDPTFLETLNHLHAADILRAQRVLPASRRKPLSSLYGKHVKQELVPAFRRVRLAIDAAQREQSDAAAAAAARQAENAEQARQGAQEARHQVTRDEMAGSPEFIAQALGKAGLGPLLDALVSRAAASMQDMIQAAIIGALSSNAVKNALVVNLHMTGAETSARSVAANPPRVSGSVASNVVVKPKVGIVGALAQQGEIIAAAYPQLRIKAIDKNLGGQQLRDAVSQCDRVIGMTGFMSHSLDGVCHKAAGERYTRVDGGVSSVRRILDVWLASGALNPAVVPAEAKGE